MERHADKAARYKVLPTSAAIIVAFIACLVLVGWFFNVPMLQSLLPGLPKMTGNTAVLFIISALSLWLYHSAPDVVWRRQLAIILASLVVLITLLILSEYLFNWNPGIDQWLIEDPVGAEQTTIPGRPSPQTAISFLFVGLSLLLLHSRNRRHHWLAQYLTLTAVFIALLALIGYIFSASFFFRISLYTGMAVHTAVNFIILCIGLLFLQPNHGLIGFLTGRTFGSIITRQLIIAAILVPLLVGWFTIWAQQIGLYNIQLQPVLLAVTSAYAFSGIIWWYTHSLNRMETDRQRAEEQFRLVVEASPNAIILVDASGKIALVNKQTEALFDHDRESLLGQPIEILVPLQFRSHHSDYRDAFIAAPTARPMGAGRDLFGIRQDGSQVPIEIGLNPIETVEGEFVLASIINITERKRAEASIAESFQREQSARVQAEAGQQRLAFLSEASTILASSLDYNVTLAAVAKLAVPRLADWCAVDLVESSGKLSRIAAAHIDPNKVPLIYRLRPSQPNPKNLQGIYHVLSTNQTEFYPEISQSFLEAAGLDDEQMNIVHELGMKSAIIVPMIIHGQAVGTITFVAGESTPHYNEDDLTLTEELANRVALAVENARLYYESRQLNEELERRVAKRTAELEDANKELEAFSYSVSHDLRAPLRSIDGFSQALLEDYNDTLDNQAQHYLQRVRASSQRMAQLIDDLLMLSRVTRSDMNFEEVNLSKQAQMIASELQQSEPEREISFIIEPDIFAQADRRLIHVALENLLNNAWKFTSKHETACIEFGKQYEPGNEPVYFVRDDGAGFSMDYADKLFGAFQRLHTSLEFPGTGIGLATVQRIIRRHGGRVWAEGAVEKGACFYFTLHPIDERQVSSKHK